ncbi:MAG: nuclease-related domain-containing protein [Bacillaceae bacterium]|uniref:nuclease-related domain-containing protein n=1 Tax=Caldibacillus debilis TaxID=301148 RepID=UPI000B56A3EE|nr:nuclease-related domain-containing protein [Caldibacillus debilis]OUM89265.1 MAG: hypothetical protein BAA03_12120 [Caldibacillus debilis]
MTKKREAPYKLLQLEALLKRLPANHPKRPFLEQEYHKRLAGYRGEQEIDFYLNYVSDHHITCLNNIRLNYDSQYFQIDTLVISPQYLLILEIKNITGTIYFDEQFGQLIRIYEGKQEGMRDPIFQVQRQKNLLLKWLKKNHFPLWPIEAFIVISNPSTIIKTSNTQPLHIVHVTKIPEIIHHLNEKYPPVKTLTPVAELADKIAEMNQPLVTDILDEYAIDPGHLIKGVRCPNCDFIPMKKIWKKWQCTKCHFISQHVYETSLDDYKLIFGNKITNRGLRDFLKIRSRSTAWYILQKFVTEKKGTNRKMDYFF